MSRMRRFTIDAESIELTHDELSRYSSIVQAACHISEQHKVSAWLSGVGHPQDEPVQNYASRQVELMWRSEARL